MEIKHVIDMPEWMDDWNWSKNNEAEILPANISASSKKKVFWKCHACGGEWETAPQYRKRNGCPYCANFKALPGYNDLRTLFPDIAAEWDAQKNGSLFPENVTKGSGKKVWWKCKKGHHWKVAISDRSRGYNCPECSEERRVSFPEKAILYYVKKIFPDVEANYRSKWLGQQELDIYIPEQKIAIEYDGEYGHSKPVCQKRDEKKNRLCQENRILLIRIREPLCPLLENSSVNYIMNSSKDLKEAIQFVLAKLSELTEKNTLFIQSDIDISRDSAEIYSLIQYSEKENSLQNKAPDIVALWHPIRNKTLTPEFVSVASSKRVWWKGTCGHEWQSPVAYEVLSGKCPYCTGKRILKGFNDLAIRQGFLYVAN